MELRDEREDWQMEERWINGTDSGEEMNQEERGETEEV